MKKFFKKGNQASPDIVATDWLQSKPYDTIDVYDRPYVQLCRQVFDILNKYVDYFKAVKLTRDHRKELAGVLVSQLEDFVNEIGIWQAFVQYYQELYDDMLPFAEIYEMDEYEADYYNPQDVLLLLWFYVCTVSEQRMISPEAEELMDITNEVYALLESQIDEVPTTDFYESFLQIPPGTNFFALKDKLRWMALDSYVLRPFTKPLLQEDLQDLAKGNTRRDFLSKFSYTAIERFLYYWHSPYLAMSVPEWLARIARGTNEQVQGELLGLQERREGMFLIEKTDSKYYHLKVQLTERMFSVLKYSFSSAEKELDPDLIYFMGIKRWNGEWHMSGSTMGLPNVPETLRAQRQRPPTAHLMTDEQMQTARESTNETQDFFVEYFGSNYVVFDTGKEMHRQVNDFYKDYQRKALARAGDDDRTPQDLDFVGTDIPMHESAAAYFNTDVGIEFYFDVKKMAAWLESAQPLTLQQSREVWDFLTDEDVSPEFARFFLQRHYKGAPLTLFPGSKVNYLKHFEFMMRYFKAGEFGEKLPRTIVLANPESLA
jgi:hypothetical protein